MLEEAVRHFLQRQANVFEADLLADDVERHVGEAVVHGAHHARQHRAVADAGVEHAQRRRMRMEEAQLLGDPVGDFPLLAAGVDEQQILLPVVEEAEIPLRRFRRATSAVTAAGATAAGIVNAGAPHVNVLCHRTWLLTMRNWRVSGDEGLNAVERVGGDAAAVAQPGSELAVIDGAPSECGLRKPGLTTIIGDFLE